MRLLWLYLTLHRIVVFNESVFEEAKNLKKKPKTKQNKTCIVENEYGETQTQAGENVCRQDEDMRDSH